MWFFKGKENIKEDNFSTNENDYVECDTCKYLIKKKNAKVITQYVRKEYSIANPRNYKHIEVDWKNVTEYVWYCPKDSPEYDICIMSRYRNGKCKYQVYLVEKEHLGFKYVTRLNS